MSNKIEPKECKHHSDCTKRIAIWSGTEFICQYWTGCFDYAPKSKDMNNKIESKECKYYGRLGKCILHSSKSYDVGCVVVSRQKWHCPDYFPKSKEK